MSKKFLSGINVTGAATLNTVADAGTNTDKFLVLESSGTVSYRTAAELYIDLGIGSLPAGYTSTLKHQVKAGVALSKGQAVYVTSANGTNIIVGKASNTLESTSSKTMGLIETSLSNNGIGNVITEGLLAGLNTIGANAGDPVWLGTDGNLIYGLTNKPYAPAHLVFIGIVTRVNANNGEIFVKVQNGFEMRELHNYAEGAVQNNEVIVYESSTSLYKPKSISTILGYNPANDSLVVHLSGTETITGYKTFSDTHGIISNYGMLITKGNTPSAITSTEVGVYAESGSNNIVFRDFSSLAKFNFPSGINSYTFPSAISGTVALTSDLSLYVPKSRTLTINGTTYDLTTDRAWTINTSITSTDVTTALGYTPANDSLVVHLSGTETITGYKTFSHSNGVLLNYGALITKGNTPGAITSTDVAIYAESGSSNIVFRDFSSLVKFNFPSAINSYTFPAAISGTIALTSDIPSLSGYVPTSRTLTINGTTYDLSVDRSWTISTGVSGSGTTNYITKFTGSTTIGNSLMYDNGSAIGINTTSPFESSQFKLDVNGGVIIKNTSGTAAQLILIDSNPATGGNNGFVQLSAGGNTGTAFGQWQTYYGTSIASGVLRLQPAGGNVLIGSSTAITGAGMLQVNGDVNITGTFKINGTAISSGGVSSFNARTGAVTLSSGDVTAALGYTPYNSTNPSGYITASGSITGSANSLNLSGHTISNSSWAGGSGYHGYTYNGGNFRFGFSSTSGAVDVYADGNFYATDSSHIVLHNGNKSSYIDTLYYGGAAHLWTGSDGTRNMGWAYHMNNGTGVHWPNNGWHIYPKDASDMYWRSGATDASIAFMRNGVQGNYVHNASDNAVGFLSSGRSWILRVTNGGDAYTTSTHYAAGYRGSANVGGTGEATWHPAGIYVGSTQWLYGTQYRNGSTTSGQGWLYMDWNYGMSIVGLYSAGRYQGVFAMGGAYTLSEDGTSPANCYGIAWSHPNAGGQAGYLTNHGSIHFMYGTAFTTISDNIWCRGNVTAYSDIRVKENIEVISNAMDKINAIRGVTFTRNDIPDTTKRQAGVIAQEVEKVLPEVITTNYSNGHLSVAYGNMVGLTIEGLKEHDIKINEQEKTIGILLEQIEYLKNIINGITK